MGGINCTTFFTNVGTSHGQWNELTELYLTKSNINPYLKYWVRGEIQELFHRFLSCTETVLSRGTQVLANIPYWIYVVYAVDYMILFILYYHHTQMNLYELIQIYIIKLYIYKDTYFLGSMTMF
jgi:hypothetical protein